MVDSDTCGDTLCAVWSMCHDGRTVLFYRSPRLPICLRPDRLPTIYLSHAVRDVSSLCIDQRAEVGRIRFRSEGPSHGGHYLDVRPWLGIPMDVGRVVHHAHQHG